MSWQLALDGFPSSWERTRLRSVLRRVRRTGRPDLPLLSVNLPVGVVRRQGSDGRPSPSRDLSGYQIVNRGDLVVNQLGKPHGALGVSDYTGIISPAYLVAEVGPRAHGRFIHYLLRTRMYISEYERRGKYMPPSQFDISWEQFRDIPLALPPLSEQRSIAAYLDNETARLDDLIAKKRQLVARIEEYIDAVIRLHLGRSTIAGGPEPSVELRHQLTPVHRAAPPGAGMVTAFRDGQVTLRSRRRTEGFMESWMESSRVQGVAVDDVVIHGLDGFAGAIGAAEASGVCSPVYHVCQPVSGDPVFLGRLLRVLAIDGYLGLFSTSTRQRAVDLRNWDLLGRIPVPRVPVSDQASIGSRLRKLRPLRGAVEKSEARAGERRQALITAAVTGEIEVPGVAA